MKKLDKRSLLWLVTNVSSSVLGIITYSVFMNSRRYINFNQDLTSSDDRGMYVAVVLIITLFLCTIAVAKVTRRYKIIPLLLMVVHAILLTILASTLLFTGSSITF